MPASVIDEIVLIRFVYICRDENQINTRTGVADLFFFAVSILFLFFFESSVGGWGYITKFHRNTHTHTKTLCLQLTAFNIHSIAPIDWENSHPSCLQMPQPQWLDAVRMFTSEPIAIELHSKIDSKRKCRFNNDHSFGKSARRNQLTHSFPSGSPFVSFRDFLIAIACQWIYLFLFDAIIVPSIGWFPWKYLAPRLFGHQTTTTINR